MPLSCVEVRIFSCFCGGGTTAAARGDGPIRSLRTDFFTSFGTVGVKVVAAGRPRPRRADGTGVTDTVAVIEAVGAKVSTRAARGVMDDFLAPGTGCWIPLVADLKR